MFDLTKFHRNLPLIMRQKYVNRAMLAEILDVTEENVSNWESGKEAPSISMYPRIAEALSVPLSALFADDGNAVPSMIIPSYEPSDTAFEETFADHSSLSLRLEYPCHVTVACGGENVTKVSVRGSREFLEHFEIKSKGDTLQVVTRSVCGEIGNAENNRIEILVGQLSGESIETVHGGSGSVTVKVPYHRGRFTVNGSGCIIASDIDTMNATVNGSGSVQCAASVNAAIQVNGSGECRFDKHCGGAFTVGISGSGTVYCAGNAESIDVQISGSGTLHAQNLACTTGRFNLVGSGNIRVGSVERVLRRTVIGSGSLQICK